MPSAKRPDAEHTERSLRKRELRLRNSFEQARVGIALVSLAGEILEVNVRLCELLGRPREELLRTPLLDILPPQDRAAHAQQLDSHQHFSIETRGLRPDADPVRISLNMTPVREGKGETTHWIALIDEIAAGPQWLSRMSHELRTPLNAVLGFAQLLRSEPEHALTPTQRSKIMGIEVAGQRLLALIDDLLELSRLDAGGIALSRQAIRLEPAVKQALAQLADAAGVAGVTLDYTAAPLALHALADAHRLRQVLLNVLSNAIKFNRRAGSVSVWCQRRGEQVCINVADTGIGFGAEQRLRLFEPFERLGAEKTAVPGAGIGLAITAKLVALMGGHIDVESELGRGTVFSVWLPAAELPSSAQRAATPAQASALSVLYADDNDLNLELVRQVLQLRPACRLQVARNGAQAIELVRSAPPDLLLLDIQLGDMSGFDVVAALERDAATARVPRIALSSDSPAEQVRGARQRGFIAYLTKPLDVAVLLRHIDDHLAARRQRNGQG